MRQECFECGSTDDLQNHHIIPRSLGGTKTIPLCGKCHSIVHNSSGLLHTSSLQKLSIKRKKENCKKYNGKSMYGYKYVGDRIEEEPSEMLMIQTIYSLNKQGLSSRKIAKKLDELNYINRIGKPFDHQQVLRILKSPLISSVKPSLQF